MATNIPQPGDSVSEDMFRILQAQFAATQPQTVPAQPTTPLELQRPVTQKADSMYMPTASETQELNDFMDLITQRLAASDASAVEALLGPVGNSSFSTFKSDSGTYRKVESLNEDPLSDNMFWQMIVGGGGAGPSAGVGGRASPGVRADEGAASGASDVQTSAPPSVQAMDTDSGAEKQLSLLDLKKKTYVRRDPIKRREQNRAAAQRFRQRARCREQDLAAQVDMLSSKLHEQTAMTQQVLQQLHAVSQEKEYLKTELVQVKTNAEDNEKKYKMKTKLLFGVKGGPEFKLGADEMVIDPPTNASLAAQAQKASTKGKRYAGSSHALPQQDSDGATKAQAKAGKVGNRRRMSYPPPGSYSFTKVVEMCSEKIRKSCNSLKFSSSRSKLMNDPLAGSSGSDAASDLMFRRTYSANK